MVLVLQKWGLLALEVRKIMLRNTCESRNARLFLCFASEKVLLFGTISNVDVA